MALARSVFFLVLGGARCLGLSLGVLGFLRVTQLKRWYYS